MADSLTLWRWQDVEVWAERDHCCSLHECTLGGAPPGGLGRFRNNQAKKKQKRKGEMWRTTWSTSLCSSPSSSSSLLWSPRTTTSLLTVVLKGFWCLKRPHLWNQYLEKRGKAAALVNTVSSSGDPMVAEKDGPTFVAWERRRPLESQCCLYKCGIQI